MGRDDSDILIIDDSKLDILLDSNQLDHSHADQAIDFLNDISDLLKQSPSKAKENMKTVILLSQSSCHS